MSPELALSPSRRGAPKRPQESLLPGAALRLGPIGSRPAMGTGDDSFSPCVACP